MIGPKKPSRSRARLCREALRAQTLNSLDDALGANGAGHVDGQALAGERVVRMVFKRRSGHPSNRARMEFIAVKMGCFAQTLNNWAMYHAGQGGSLMTLEAQHI